MTTNLFSTRKSDVNKMQMNVAWFVRFASETVSTVFALDLWPIKNFFASKYIFFFAFYLWHPIKETDAREREGERKAITEYGHRNEMRCDEHVMHWMPVCCKSFHKWNMVRSIAPFLIHCKWHRVYDWERCDSADEKAKKKSEKFYVTATTTDGDGAINCFHRQSLHSMANA